MVKNFLVTLLAVWCGGVGAIAIEAVLQKDVHSAHSQITTEKVTTKQECPPVVYGADPKSAEPANKKPSENGPKYLTGSTTGATTWRQMKDGELPIYDGWYSNAGILHSGLPPPIEKGGTITHYYSGQYGSYTPLKLPVCIWTEAPLDKWMTEEEFEGQLFHEDCYSLKDVKVAEVYRNKYGAGWRSGIIGKLGVWKDSGEHQTREGAEMFVGRYYNQRHRTKNEK